MIGTIYKGFNKSLNKGFNKSLNKGFNKYISQIFVVKEEDEMQIGCPTDVKHVAHIGWDSSSASSPNWMNKFDAGPDVAVSSVGASDPSHSPCSSPDMEDMIKEAPSIDVRPKPKKHRRKKIKSSTSSPRAGHVKSKTPKKQTHKLTEGNAMHELVH